MPMWHDRHRTGQTVDQHGIDGFSVAHAVAPSRSLQNVRRIGHRFGAASYHGVHVADADRFHRVDDGLHPGTAHPVHGFGRHFDRQPGLKRGLTRHVHPRARPGAHNPMTVSPTSAGFTRARAIASRIATAPRSTADKSFNTPPNDPIGVRHALRITVSKSFDIVFRVPSLRCYHRSTMKTRTPRLSSNAGCHCRVGWNDCERRC